MKTTVCIIMVLISIMAFDPCTAQTFQYSRGWTNGKRSETVPGGPPVQLNGGDIPESFK